VRAAEAELNVRIAQEIYDLRTKAGLTQKQLAKMIGTTDSVISRLEDADYRGHSLKTLHRISQALNRRLEVHFVPTRPRRKSA
jgi:transcriptional regulator with XRE-family HTH domain